MSAAGLARAVGAGETSAAAEAALARADVRVLPVAGVTAFTHRPPGADLTAGYSEPVDDRNGLTALAGTPAAVGTRTAGLPAGLQMHARRGADGFLLGVAAAVEAAGLPRVPAPFGSLADGPYAPGPSGSPRASQRSRKSVHTTPKNTE